jgi:hypothetical protein
MSQSVNTAGLPYDVYRLTMLEKNERFDDKTRIYFGIGDHDPTSVMVYFGKLTNVSEFVDNITKKIVYSYDFLPYNDKVDVDSDRYTFYYGNKVDEMITGDYILLKSYEKVFEIKEIAPDKKTMIIVDENQPLKVDVKTGKPPTTILGSIKNGIGSFLNRNNGGKTKRNKNARKSKTSRKHRRSRKHSNKRTK